MPFPFYLHTEGRRLAVRLQGVGQFLAHRRQQVREIDGSDRSSTQALNRIPALGDSLVRPGKSAIENAHCVFGAPGKHVTGRLKAEYQPVQALQQGIVHLARDAHALADPRFQAYVE